MLIDCARAPQKNSLNRFSVPLLPKPHLKDDNGFTALACVMWYSDVEAVRLLLQYKADPYASEKFKFVKENSSKNILNILAEYKII